MARFRKRRLGYNFRRGRIKRVFGRGSYWLRDRAPASYGPVVPVIAGGTGVRYRSGNATVRDPRMPVV